MASLRVAQILTAVVAGTGPTSPLDNLPQRLVATCAQALPISGAGIALMTDAGPAGVVAVTDGSAALMEELQFTLGEGPCIDSSRSGRPVLQPDLAATGPSRWPGFSSAALEAGIAAIFALPLRIGGIRLGVLDLYRDRAGGLSAPELAEALAYADAATAILLHLQAWTGTDGSDGGFFPVLEDRAEVHQATGIVSVQAGVALAEALVLLRARAFAAERHVLDLSRDVVNGAVRFTNNDGEIDNG